MSAPMDDLRALRLAYGLDQVQDADEAMAAADYLDANPWIMTTGEAMRGLERLRAIAYGSAD
jgi:hypothetical protein